MLGKLVYGCGQELETTDLCQRTEGRSHFLGVLLEMVMLLLWVMAMEGGKKYVRGEEEEEVVVLDVFLARKTRT